MRLMGILVICLMQTSFVFGQSTDPIQELMVLSGLEDQVRQMWIGLRADLAERRQEAPAESVQILEQLEQELTLTVNTETIRANINARLKNELTPVEIETVLEFFRSPFGARLAHLQRTAWIGEMLKPKKRAGGPAPGTSTENIVPLRRLGMETHMVQVQWVWSTCTGTALMSAASGSRFATGASPGTPAFDTAVEETMQVLEGFLREIHSKDLPASMESPGDAFLEVLYRPLGRDSLDKYLDFAQSQAGSKFYRISGTAILRSWIGGCLEAGYRLRERITGGGIR